MSACASTPAKKPLGPNASRVLVVSIDGLTPDFYRNETLPTPTLQGLARKGASAEGLIPIYPTVTYPNHTTLVTGVLSKEHGIYANRIFSPEDGPTPRWYFDSGLIRVPTVWERAAQSGLNSALLNWPVTVGAKAKWVVPEIFPEQGFDMGAIWALTERVTERDLFRELARVTQTKGFTDTLQHDRWIVMAARHLWKSKLPALTLAHLTHVDVTQHLSGTGTAAHREAARQLDELLGEWVSEINLDADCLIILGDHGFEEIRNEIRINDLFRSKGWIWENSSGATRWKVVADSLGGPAAIYLRDQSIREEVRKTLIENQTRAHYRLIDRDELEKLGAFPDAAWMVEPDPSYAVAKDLGTESAAGKSLTRALPSPKGEHGYLPSNPRMLSGFIAVGKCAQPGRNLGLIQVTDVAATIASELGVPWPTSAGKSIPLTLNKP